MTPEEDMVRNRVGRVTETALTLNHLAAGKGKVAALTSRPEDITSAAERLLLVHIHTLKPQDCNIGPL